MTGEEWIAHDGKEQPVDDEVKVWLTYRDGGTDGEFTAGDIGWRHIHCEDDIMAYREVVA
jgi:hypothetical protein